MWFRKSNSTNDCLALDSGTRCPRPSTLAAVLVVFAPVIASAFHLSEAAPVLRGLSLSVVFVVLGSVPSALLRRGMQFRLLALQGLVSTFVAQVVAILLAFRGAGAWALVMQLIVAQAVACILAWKAARWRPGFQFSKSHFVAMAKFGNKVVMVDLVATVRAAAEAAIISTVLGSAALGYLSIAQRLVQVTQDLGAAALVPVSTVVFAKVRDSAGRLQSAYLRALRISYSAVSPIMTVVVVGGPLVVPLLFGDGWDQSVPVAQALALAAIFVLGAMLDHGLHYGVGRPGRWLAYSVFIDALTVAVTALAAPKGLTWVAVGFVLVALAATVARWMLVGRLLDIRVRTLAGIFLTACVAVAGSAGAGLLVRNLTDGWAPIWSLAAVAVTIGLVHVGIVRVVSPGVYRDRGFAGPPALADRFSNSLTERGAVPRVRRRGTRHPSRWPSSQSGLVTELVRRRSHRRTAIPLRPIGPENHTQAFSRLDQRSRSRTV